MAVAVAVALWLCGSVAVVVALWLCGSVPGAGRVRVKERGVLETQEIQTDTSRISLVAHLPL